MEPHKFYIRQVVRIIETKQVGTIRGITFSQFDETQFFLEHLDGAGNLVSIWYPEHVLEQF